MLQRLTVCNYALIEEVSLTFGKGMTVITGETGSGKSILLGALGLVLGDRADLSALRSPEAKCIVEALFRVDNTFRPLFEDEDLDFELDTIVRREITPSGKSRAFINDTPVNLRVLTAFGRKVIDIHSQLETSQLREKSFRINLLDATANQMESVQAWQLEYKRFLSLTRELQALIDQEAKSASEQDYLKFQLQELEEAGLEAVDLESLENDAETMRNAEQILQNLGSLTHALQDAEQAIVPALKRLLQQIDHITSVFPVASSLRERLNSSYIELSDIADEIASQADTIDTDPKRLAEIEQKLDSLYLLQSKHRLNAVTDLLVYRDELRERLSFTDSLEEKILEYQQVSNALYGVLYEGAAQIHSNRVQAALTLQENVASVLSKLKMPDAKLHFDLNLSDNLDAHGRTSIQLLFNPNRGGSFSPMEKIASGGELSRLMLALKSGVASFTSLPTIVFDEIDTGVSGEVAERMAETMKSMASDLQLICISHLPQIAAKASDHFKVLKSVSGNETFTSLVRLSPEERLEEVASMISGERITDEAREQARVLLQQSSNL